MLPGALPQCDSLSSGAICEECAAPSMSRFHPLTACALPHSPQALQSLRIQSAIDLRKAGRRDSRAAKRGKDPKVNALDRSTDDSGILVRCLAPQDLTPSHVPRLQTCFISLHANFHHSCAVAFLALTEAAFGNCWNLPVYC